MTPASAVVPVGYKQTEVGVIPEDWVIKTVSDISVVSRGRVISQKEISRQINPKYPVYSSQTTNYGIFGFLDTFDYEGEYVTWTTDGVNAGKTFHRNGRFNCTNVCGTIKLISNENPYFISLVLGRQTPNHVSTQLANPKLMNDIMKKIPIPIPSNKIEQKRIANVILNSEITINFLENLISKKKDIKQGAMQELLTGKTRLSGFTDEWNRYKISDFTNCAAGGTPSTSRTDYWNGVIRWMNSGELNLKIVNDVEGRITTLGLKESSTRLIPANCILIGLAGQGKTRGTVAINTVELSTNQSIAAIFPNNQFISKWLYYNLDNRYSELRRMSTGDSGRGGLNLTIIRSINIDFPSYKEQEAIAEVLSDMDAEITNLERRLEKAKAIKQGMMQQLLTGKIRLVD